MSSARESDWPLAQIDTHTRQTSGATVRSSRLGHHRRFLLRRRGVRRRPLPVDDLPDDTRPAAAGDFDQPVLMQYIDGAVRGAHRNRVRGRQFDHSW